MYSNFIIAWVKEAIQKGWLIFSQRISLAFQRGNASIICTIPLGQNLYNNKNKLDIVTFSINKNFFNEKKGREVERLPIYRSKA